jgi:hypothetical protein
MLSPIVEQASFASSGNLSSNAGVSSEQFLSLLKTDHTHQSVESAICGNSLLLEDDTTRTKPPRPDQQIDLNENDVDASENESEYSSDVLHFDNPCNPFIESTISSILESARERFGTPSNLHFEGKVQIFKPLENAAKVVPKAKSVALQRDALREMNVQVSLAVGCFMLLEKVGEGGFARFVSVV